jgi:hypothetical protein
MTSQRTALILLELVICCVHPIPGEYYFTWTTKLANHGGRHETKSVQVSFRFNHVLVTIRSIIMTIYSIKILLFIFSVYMLMIWILIRFRSMWCSHYQCFYGYILFVVLCYCTANYLQTRLREVSVHWIESILTHVLSSKHWWQSVRELALWYFWSHYGLLAVGLWDYAKG